MTGKARSRVTWPFLVAIAMLAVACSGSPGETATAEPLATSTTQSGVGGSGSTPAPGSTPVPRATSTPVPVEEIVISDPGLPMRPVLFNVTVPENTPDGDSVYVMVDTVDSGAMRTHVELQQQPDGTYQGQLDLPVGGLVRYVYDRWDEAGCCEDRLITRESLFTGQPVGYRSLIVDQRRPEVGTMLVRDVVPQWNDLETEFHRVDVSGGIVDKDTLEPLMDIDVTIAGVHVATDFRGGFEVPGIAPGVHRIVTTSVTGAYRMVQQEITVGRNDLAIIEPIAMERVSTVPVQFTALLPDRTPTDAGVFIAGNLRQLGGRPGSQPNLPAIPSGISMPIMSRDGDVATLTVDLPVGAYVEYFYTLGSDVAAEVANYDRMFRSFVVGDSAENRNDSVTAWGSEDWPLVTLRVDVPENTPDGVPVFLHDGPMYRMNQVGPNKWVTVVGSHPPGGKYEYDISLGDNMSGSDDSPGIGEQGRRSVVFSDEPAEVAVKVTKWAHLPDPTARDERNGLTVTFRLSVPPDTPEGATIILTGDRPAIGSEGTAMRPVPGNPWLYEADVNFGHDGTLRYRYTVTETGNSSDEMTVNTDYHGQEVNDYIPSWSEPPESRDEWVSGLFTPDFWSEAFLAKSASAFEAGAEVNGDWVAISSVWSFGEILPDPYVESRPVRIWTVLTPIDDIRAQAAIAREKGLKIFLAPQMNPEVLPDWQDQTVSPGSKEWWEQWLRQAEAQWMWNAVVGEEIGAEMLMLPGYVFHVFPPPGFFEDESYVPEFDLKVQELIGKVREVYSGKIMISGSQAGYDFPGLADYVGVTTYDIGVPELPGTATFDELKAHYGAEFKDKVDNRWERWGKPVMLYTIHADSKAQDGDPFGQLYQAAAYEAMFQEVDARPFMAGAFSWAFDYAGVWQFETSGVRNRAAGAVMAKWYERLGGR